MGSDPVGVPRPLRRTLVLAGGLSLVAWVLLQWLAPPEVLPWTPSMRRAAATMGDAMEATRAYCDREGIPVDPALDPSESCLVGPQLTPLFTTLGQLEAKRTTINPAAAGLLVYLLRQAGVGPGSTVAIGASGSFPALLIGALAAAEALDATAVPILSLGASSYGATRLEFHLLDILGLLNRQGILHTPPATVSLGGRRDVGGEFPDTLKASLIGEIRNLDIPFLAEDSLAANVARRMEIYCGGGSAAGGATGAGPRVRSSAAGDSAGGLAGGSAPDRAGACPVTVFVNIGGAQANMGVSPAILEVPPGLTLDLPSLVPTPPAAQRGVLFEMADRGIPVIHLLHVRGLALAYGLPWDPAVLSPPGTSRLLSGRSSTPAVFWLITAVYLLGLGILLFRHFFSRRTMRQRSASRSFHGMS